jgi:DNA transformation protein
MTPVTPPEPADSDLHAAAPGRAHSPATSATVRDTPAQPIALRDLDALGPKSEAMLMRAGITSVAQLQSLGAVAAYVIASRANGGVSLNLLWALESALTGVPWQTVARVHRTSLLLALEAAEQDAANADSGAG